MTFNPDPLLTLHKKIVQYETILAELNEAQNKEQISFTHDTKTDFMGRQRLFNTLKDRAARIKYFEREIIKLKKSYDYHKQNGTKNSY